MVWTYFYILRCTENITLIKVHVGSKGLYNSPLYNILSLLIKKQNDKKISKDIWIKIYFILKLWSLDLICFSKKSRISWMLPHLCNYLPRGSAVGLPRWRGARYVAYCVNAVRGKGTPGNAVRGKGDSLKRGTRCWHSPKRGTRYSRGTDQDLPCLSLGYPDDLRFLMFFGSFCQCRLTSALTCPKILEKCNFKKQKRTTLEDL